MRESLRKTVNERDWEHRACVLKTVQGRRNRSGNYKSGFRRTTFPPALNFFFNVRLFILLYNSQVIASASESRVHNIGQGYFLCFNL